DAQEVVLRARGVVRPEGLPPTAIAEEPAPEAAAVVVADANEREAPVVSRGRLLERPRRGVQARTAGRRALAVPGTERRGRGRERDRAGRRQEEDDPGHGAPRSSSSSSCAAS